MSGQLLQNPRPQILDSNGDPVSGGTLYFYVVGTTTPKAVYSDSDLLNSLGSSVVLDSSGRPSTDIYMDGSYKVVVKDAAAATLYTAASVNATAGGAFELQNDLSPQLGGNLDVQTYNIIATGANDLDLVTDTGAINLNGDSTVTGTFDVTGATTVTGTFGVTGNTTLTGTLSAGATTITGTTGITGTTTITGTSNLSGNVNIGTGSSTVVLGNMTMPNSATTVGHVLSVSSSNVIAAAAPIPSLRTFEGLVTQYAADANHDVTINVGGCRPFGDQNVVMNLTSAITKQIDATWAAGNNAGGRPAAVSYSANTHYYVYLIMHTNGTVDAGFDTSNTAANLLSASGYTYYRRVGFVYTDSTPNNRAFLQSGNTWTYTTPISTITGATPSTIGAALNITSVPNLPASFGTMIRSTVRNHSASTTKLRIDAIGTLGAVSDTGTTMYNIPPDSPVSLNIVATGQYLYQQADSATGSIYVLVHGFTDLTLYD